MSPSFFLPNLRIRPRLSVSHPPLLIVSLHRTWVSTLSVSLCKCILSFYPFVSVAHLRDYTKLLIMRVSNVRQNSSRFWAYCVVFFLPSVSFDWQPPTEPNVRNANLAIKLNQEIFSNKSDSMLLVLVSCGWSPKEHTKSSVLNAYNIIIVYEHSRFQFETPYPRDL